MLESVLFEVLILAGGVLGYFQLRQKHISNIETLKVEQEAKRKALESKASADRAEQHTATQTFIREKLDEERQERQRLDKTIDELARANSRHAEMRAVAETQADERKQTIIMQERVIGETVNRAIDEAKKAASEQAKKDMLERENTELRNRLKAMEAEVRRIPSLENEIARLKGAMEQNQKAHIEREVLMRQEIEKLNSALMAQGEQA